MFRRFLAGPVTFGLVVGLGLVAFVLEGFAWEAGGVLTLAAWGVAGLVAVGALWLGWPVFHAGAGGALLVAWGSMVGSSVWAFPLAAGVGAMVMARFASVGFASRWVSRGVGAAALGGLAWFVFGAFGKGAWAGVGVVDIAVGGIGLVSIAVMGLWHASGEAA